MAAQSIHKDNITTTDIELFKQCKKSADKGNAVDADKVGDMYFYGRGVEKNYKKAVIYFTNSSKKGNVEGQWNLAYMYQYGLGVAQNYDVAKKWYKKSALKGNARCQFALGILYKNHIKVSKEAVKWFLESAKQGHVGAQLNIGTMYFYGENCTKDYSEASKWFTLAVAQNCSAARYYLAEIFRYGLGGDLNRNQARILHTQSSKQGYFWSQHRLADMYFEDKNYFEAFRWYICSAENGDKDSLNCIEKLSYAGRTTNVLSELFFKNDQLKIEIEQLEDDYFHLKYRPNSAVENYAHFLEIRDGKLRIDHPTIFDVKIQ